MHFEKIEHPQWNLHIFECFKFATLDHTLFNSHFVFRKQRTKLFFPKGKEVAKKFIIEAFKDKKLLFWMFQVFQSVLFIITSLKFGFYIKNW